MSAPLTSAPILTPDKDGIIMPPKWAPNPKNWEAQPASWRKKRSDEYLAELAESLKPKPAKVRRPGSTRFTTDACIAWGRKQTTPGADRKWTLIEREGYDHRLKRHHDCELGSDAIFDDHFSGRVAVQGAGVGERKEHWERFITRGGVEKAKRRNLRFVYLEFVRGQAAPVKVEWWVA